jgi:tetratricopeptide (TPR) repeat protein/2-polyprenyl-3-methyl-5-hydroxy-6-metoxy-1,4-benzoquinol methylase
MKELPENQVTENNPPSQQQIDTLLGHYQSNHFEEFEKLARWMTEEFPAHQIGWKALGVALKKRGKVTESLAPMRRSVDLAPRDAEAHHNFGITLQELGRLDEAEASHNQAIALKPGYAQAHNDLGATLQAAGRLTEAVASYNQAITLEPDYAEAYSNLAITLRQLGSVSEAIVACVRAVTIKPDFTTAYGHLGLVIKNVVFEEPNPSLYPIFIHLLATGNLVRPIDAASPILSLLRHDPRIKDLLSRTKSIETFGAAVSAIDALDQFPLLHQLMRVCPLPDLQLEEMFASIRRWLLIDLDEIKPPPSLIEFLSTLSLHCFTNEYVYFETERESELIRTLEAVISEAIEVALQPRITDVLLLACYRPLHLYSWCERLETLDQLPAVRGRLIEEPLAERVLAKNMPVLADVEDEVSRKVREQYEESPYPRWVKLRIPAVAKSVAKFCDDAKLRIHLNNIKDVSSPSILIAGCGTGQHSIGVASRFENSQIRAVDLSRTSLAYAQRKTTELGISNIEYLQGDILMLDRLQQEFDVIESVGVLHHMDDPMLGWRVLVDLLTTGGLIKIGLYSELARRSIVKVREEIASLQLGASEAEIRRYRLSLANSDNPIHQQVSSYPDFYSLSMLRDAIFHVKEHRFTLPQIEGCLAHLGLKFCGFESWDIVGKFKDCVGEEADIYDLSLWHEFEENNPNIFSGMYQFWCQKI